MLQAAMGRAIFMARFTFDMYAVQLYVTANDMLHN